MQEEEVVEERGSVMIRGRWISPTLRMWRKTVKMLNGRRCRIERRLVVVVLVVVIGTVEQTKGFKNGKTFSEKLLKAK